MKRVDDWWIDENNNKWNAHLYTKDDAENYSKTLINCIDCDNCDNCVNCYNCNGYITNPSRYITQNIGSREGQTHFYYGKTKEDSMSIQIKCGCFHGDLKEFAEAVEKTHGDNKYGEQYRKEIEKMKALFELEAEE